MAAARDAFFATALAGVRLSDAVVLDESYATTKFTRLRGRSLRGTRLVSRVPHGHWKRLTILAAVGVSGVVAAASVDASTDTDVFVTFVRDALCPALVAGQVVVMDNLAPHHAAAVVRLIEGVGCRAVYLPPYSPDLSPIEPMWSKLKQSVRSQDARTVAGLNAAIEHAFTTITPGDCLGYFTGCGYTLRLR